MSRLVERTQNQRFADRRTMSPVPLLNTRLGWASAFYASGPPSKLSPDRFSSAGA